MYRYEDILVTCFVSDRRRLIVDAQRTDYLRKQSNRYYLENTLLIRAMYRAKSSSSRGQFYDPCTSYLSERIARDYDCYSQSLAGTAVNQAGRFSFRLPACVPDTAGIPPPLPLEFIV